MKPLKRIFESRAAVFAGLLIAALGTGCVTPGGSNTELFNGKDLTGWEVTDFAGGGAIEVKDGEIHIAMGELISGINLAHENIPRTNYELSAEAMKLDGNDFFCGLTFPVGDTYASFIPGGWGGTVVGISSIDGMDASENETATFKEFKTHQWYRFRVRVTPGKIQCWMDDEMVVDLLLEDRSIAPRPGPIELSVPIGITSFQTVTRIRNIRLQPIKP
ncbi:MAG: DUF1080 domain-containing protein [Verrucomicrobiota bacterium]|nr:DUF1080 domain-containing protein [Verrucomicrobiota bacterium]|tara:strand:- start:303 stop:956 length:654 start_codon:yes stop_codon:yes gene_type:complete